MYEVSKIVDEAFAIEKGCAGNRPEFSALVTLLHGRVARNIMEIGTEGGCTFYAWCKASSPEGLKISLDWGWGASGTGNYRGEQARFDRDARISGFAKNVRRIEGNSHDLQTRLQVEHLLNGEPLDFLFIDGDHLEEGVRQDWLDYGPLVRPGGIVAFHDIKECDYHKRAGVFVHEFWKKLTGSKIEFLDSSTPNGGVGVLFV